MIFRQLFEASSSTYTYIIACQEQGVVALIDP
ncbi:MAG: MBL fold metallo-hydrolase, partial [Gammaproteobacteria bacterium]|nr:MBL fold metallo-hydrolase [Gammaproteobacteria bacterium]